MSKNVVVLGGGPGGYAAAIYLARMGQKVRLIEKENLGGTCLNVGCIPTKAFVQASHAYGLAKQASDYGIQIDGIAVDFKKTAKFKKTVVTRLRSGVSYLLKNAGVEVISGTGKLLDGNTVEVTDREGSKVAYHADDIVLATGSSEIELSGLNTDGTHILNSTQMLDMKQLPESVTIIGGGVIGVEFASVFNSFGKKVNIVELSPRIIPAEDGQISETLKEILHAKGVQIYTEAKAAGIKRRTESDITLEVVAKEGGRFELTTAQILVCVGRKANLCGIGLENAGIQFHEKCIETNGYMQTNKANIYAVGDITGSPQLAHVAYHEALIAAKHISGVEAAVDYHAVPGCIFSSPEVARVGLTEEAAREKYKNVQVKSESFSGNGKAMIEMEGAGYVKLIWDGDSGTVLGCSIIGPKATELIAEPTLAVKLDVPIAKFAENINAHPSLSEMIGETAAAAIGLNLHSS